jgi:hypothetical protein
MRQLINIKLIQTGCDILTLIWRFAMNYTMLTANGDTHLKIITVSLILSITIAWIGLGLVG